MWNACAWPQERWKSCSNGSYFNIVALRFGDHGTNEVLGVVGWKVWPVSNFAQQLQTTRDNMQDGVQTDATCNIQECWELLAINVATIFTGLKKHCDSHSAVLVAIFPRYSVISIFLQLLWSLQVWVSGNDKHKSSEGRVLLFITEMLTQ